MAGVFHALFLVLPQQPLQTRLDDRVLDGPRDEQLADQLDVSKGPLLLLLLPLLLVEVVGEVFEELFALLVLKGGLAALEEDAPEVLGLLLLARGLALGDLELPEELAHELHVHVDEVGLLDALVEEHPGQFAQDLLVVLEVVQDRVRHPREVPLRQLVEQDPQVPHRLRRLTPLHLLVRVELDRQRTPQRHLDLTHVLRSLLALRPELLQVVDRVHLRRPLYSL